jgi:dipeptidyl aminopeptidase/acylaminoacyl peptidase
LGANATNRYQVFTGTINNGIQRQITIATARDSKQVTISADGEKVAFSSNASLLGTNNRYNIFVASFRGEVEKQITDSVLFDSVLPSLSGDASRVAFVSSASLDDRGLSNNSNNQEAYVYDLNRERGYQVSEVNEGRNVEDLTFADNGNALLFSGTGDWETGSNPSRTRQMFIIEGFGDNSVFGYEEEMTPWPVVKSDNGEYAEKFISNGGHTSLLWIVGLALLGLRRRRNK